MLNFVEFECDDDAVPEDDGSELFMELDQLYSFNTQELLDWLDALRFSGFWLQPKGARDRLSPGQAAYLDLWRSQTGRTLLDECEEVAPKMARIHTSLYKPPTDKPPIYRNGNPFTPVTHAGLLLLSNLVESDACGISVYKRLQALHYLDASGLRDIPISAAEAGALAAVATQTASTAEVSSWILELLHFYLQKFGGGGVEAKKPRPPKSDEEAGGTTEMGVMPRPDDALRP